MRVLICLRPNAPNDHGGDWLQLQATLPSLRALGVQADFTVDRYPDFSGYDVCLIWNTVDVVPALYYYFEARRQNKPVAIMPIHWSLRRFWEVEAQRSTNTPNVTATEIEQLGRQVLGTRQKILMQGADALLPLSQGEANRLREDFQAPGETMHIVHYGIDPLYAQGSAERFIERFEIRDFILCVGFISSRKNQLSLIRALAEDSRPLVLIGDVETPGYDEECREAAAQRTSAPTLFLPRQDPTVVADALAAARVHAILSLFDVGPLVALEAAQAGCPQVVTTECGMPEYLRDEVRYADPTDPEGIRTAIDAAWNQERSQQLAERLRSEFTWERSAREISRVLEWTRKHPNSAPDPARDLVQIGEKQERRVTLSWKLIEEHMVSLRATQEWASAAQAQADASQRQALASQAQAETSRAQAQASQEQALASQAQAEASQAKAEAFRAQAEDARAQAHEVAMQAKKLEDWAHELEAANREQQETLKRIQSSLPMRAAMSLREAFTRKPASSNRGNTS